MKNYKAIALTFVPIVIAGIIYFLDETNVLTYGRDSIGAGGGSGEDTPVLIAFGLCGMFLSLIVIPALFSSSFLRWKTNSSWGLQLVLIPIACLAISVIVMGAGYGALLLIPLYLIVFLVAWLTTLNMIRKENSRSNFFFANLLLALIIIVCYFIVINIDL